MKKIAKISRAKYDDNGNKVGKLSNGKRKVISIDEVENKYYLELVKEPNGRFRSLAAALNGTYYMSNKMRKEIEKEKGKGVNVEKVGKSKAKLPEKQKEDNKEPVEDKKDIFQG